VKQQLREQIRRAAVPAGASETIQRRLMMQDWWPAAFQTGIYRATPNEPSTDALLADLRERGARVAAPVWRGTEYGWGWVADNARWQKKAHGILEPVQAAPASPSDLRVIVVPGVAFDGQGGRLGHGRGHFDRLLSPCGALLVGLCFENRFVDAVPMEPHDIRMDVVVTERRMIFAPTAAAKLEWLTG
jgi:5-formyltetrahydrofolate cyclo-ligase